MINYWKRVALSYPSQKYLSVSYWNIQIFEWNTQLLMNEVFLVKSSAPYYLKHKNELCSEKTVICGTESISLMAPKIWSLVPQQTENCQSIFFQRKVLRNGNWDVHVGYAKPTWNMLVLSNKDVLHLKNNIFICVVYMLFYLYVI